MKSNRKLVFVLFLLAPLVFFGQINISKIVKPSTSAKSTENALYLIDFWATWCAPCIHVSKYLSVLQKQYPNSFYVVSLTQESPETVNKFLNKHTTDLAVAIDYNGETFKKYNIKSLPKGILLNAKGQVVWEGHPADLKAKDVSRFLKRSKGTMALESMFNIKEDIPKNAQEVSYQPKSDIEVFEIEDYNFNDAHIIDKELFTEIKGSVQSIFAYVFKVYPGQIEIDSHLNAYYKVYIGKNPEINRKAVLENLLGAFNLELTQSEANGEVIKITIEDASFWDVNQIDWGAEGNMYLVDDSQIQANNVSLIDVKYKLSSVLETPIILTNNYTSMLYDWQIHYKYFSLMQADLLDNFGLNAEKITTNYPVYHLTKKTPN